MQTARVKSLLVVSAFTIVTAIVAGLFWFFFLGTNAPVGAGWYLFSFAAGITMIVLPCTLPLAFVIVPLSMGKGPLKGLGMALAFGFGVALTLSMYGILAAVLGQVAIGTFGAPLEVVKNWLYFIAGLLAYLFALGELGLINFRMPSYGGAAPAFIQKQKDIVKALSLGLFLGNIGVGCPHPATPMILTRIAVSGNVFYGWLLFFVHALGRILPLILLAILGILGVNALQWLVARKDKVERATGWGMVFVAGFILVLGLFTHDWWVYSGQHTLLEEFTQEEQFIGLIIERFNFAGAPHAHGIPTGAGLLGLPLALGNWALALLWIIPIWWALFKRKKTTETLSEEEKKVEAAIQPLKVNQAAIFTVIIVLLIVFILPDRFYARSMLSSGDHPPAAGGAMSGADHHATGSAMMGTDASHAGHTAMYHEEADVQAGLTVALTQTPKAARTGVPTQFGFFVNEKPAGTPITTLDVNHEKLMHVIGLRDDMNEFFHIHPDQARLPGRFSVNHTFKAPGTYKIWSEVTYQGGNHTIGHAPVVVSGQGETTNKQVSFGRSVIAGDYQVLLGYDSTLVASRSSELSVEVHNAQGQEIELEPYLGVSMHMAVISEDFSTFLHVHPGDAHMHAQTPPSLVPAVYADEGHAHTGASTHGVPFSVLFPKPGIYKVFAQFRPKGIQLPPDQAILASFWVQVEDKPAFPFNPWWFLLVVSVIAIALLSFATREFLTVKEIPAGKGIGHE